jgi:amidophosphoribosyltransferase
MCGIVGLVLGEDDVASPMLLEALTSLQHRGQDAAGIATVDLNSRTKLVKGNGQVSDVFKEDSELIRLTGSYGIGHVRYPTAGTSSDAEAQPFYTNSPLGISLAHNGNLTNTKSLRDYCRQKLRRQINTESDSELILAVFADELGKALGDAENHEDDYSHVFAAVEQVMKVCEGAFAIVLCVTGVGIVGFRDPHGIRPLCYGERMNTDSKAYMLSSESVAVEIAGFQLVRDVNPGECVLLPMKPNAPDARVITKQCTKTWTLSPCIFEYVYFARPDSVIDGALVFEARSNMGDRLASRIRELHPTDPIDIVVPIPSTSRVSAMQCALGLNVPYVEALVRNRYTQRTFIMPGQKKRNKSVRLKLNPVAALIKGKSVLLVDDSIVRGTTSKHIVEIVRAAGARHVYFASAAPAIRFPNVYGIDMPTRKELIAYNRDEAQISKEISADWVIYQSIPDLVSAVRACNPKLRNFDMSCFDGIYCAGPLPDGYFDSLDQERSDEAKEKGTNGAPASAKSVNGSNGGATGLLPQLEKIKIAHSVSSSAFGF